MSCASSLGYTPPQDKTYNNLVVLDRLVAKNLVGCNLNGKTLVVDDLVVNNSILAPQSTNGQYNPTIVSISAGLTVTSAPVANFLRVGEVVTVSGSIGLLDALNLEKVIQLSLPFPTVTQPLGVVTWIQSPPGAVNSASGAVYPFTGTPDVAEITVTFPAGIPGVVVFQFSYVAA